MVDVIRIPDEILPANGTGRSRSGRRRSETQEQIQKRYRRRSTRTARKSGLALLSPEDQETIKILLKLAKRRPTKSHHDPIVIREQLDRSLGSVIEWNEDLASAVLEIVANERSGLRVLCKKYDWFPGYRTVIRWRLEHPGFNKSFLEAKQWQMDAVVEDARDIADKVKPRSNAHVAKAKLQVETRHWEAQRLAPRKYANKLMGDPDNPICVDWRGLLATVKGTRGKIDTLALEDGSK